MLNRRIALIGIVVLLPLWGFVPLKAKAEVNLVEEYVYVAEESPVLEPNLEIAQDLYKEWAKPKPKRVVAKIAPKGTSTGGNYCSCVLTVKAWTGYSKSIGIARNWERNSPIPVVGGVLIENLTKAGHVSYIEALDEEYIYVKEGNFNRCQFGRRRIPRTSKAIIGYWQPTTSS